MDVFTSHTIRLNPTEKNRSLLLLPLRNGRPRLPKRLAVAAQRNGLPSALCGYARYIGRFPSKSIGRASITLTVSALDLMGVHDLQTMQQLEKARARVQRSASLYGGRWLGGAGTNAYLRAQPKLLSHNLKNVKQGTFRLRAENALQMCKRRFARKTV